MSASSVESRPRRAARRSALLLALLLALVLSAEPATAEDQIFEFERLNGLYSNPDPPLAPVSQGGLTVTLRSPANQVRMHSHRLRLSPLGDGTHGAFLRVEIEGRGDVEADLALAGAVTHLTDEVEIPRQSVAFFGQIKLLRVEGGYQITAVELQPGVKIEIRSRLSRSLADTCRGFTRMLPLGIDCGGLEASLAEATIPLPGPGETFLLPDEGLGEEDRRRLDAYLSGSLP